MEQPGVAAAATISVLLMEPLLIANRVRHRSPRRCGDPDPSPTTGKMSADFSHTSSQFFWKVCTEQSLSFGMLLTRVQMIKVAIMRHGCIYISAIGTISGLIKRSTTGTFVSGKELRVLDMDLKNVISAGLFATTRSRRRYLLDLIECPDNCREVDLYQRRGLV